MVRIHPDPPHHRGARGCSSAGRAPALQAGGRRFDPDQLHQFQAGRAGVGGGKQRAELSRTDLVLIFGSAPEVAVVL